MSTDAAIISKAERAENDQVVQTLNAELPEVVQLILEGMGTAGIEVMKPLKAMLPHLPDKEIAALILRTPSTLVRRIEKNKALEIQKLLIGIGLDVRLYKPDQSIPAQDKAYDLALNIKHTRRMTELLKIVVHLLGVTPQQAIQILTREPCVLLGGLSLKSAQDIAARFDTDIVETMISEPKAAVFDAFIAQISASLHHTLRQRLTDQGLVKHLISQVNQIHDSHNKLGVHNTHGGEFSGLLAYELTLEQGEKLFEELRIVGADCQLINRDYQRYDLWLMQGHSSDIERISRVLHQVCAIPEKVIPKLFHRLPIVVGRHVPFSEVSRQMTALTEAGAEVKAELANGQRFHLEIDILGDPKVAKAALENIADASQMQLSSLLEGRQTRLDNAMTRVQASWTVHEINQAGGQAKMILLGGGR